MATFDEPRLQANYTAAVDLSAKQFTYVKSVSDTTINTAGGATGEIGQGFLLNKPTIGINAEVAGPGGGAMVKLAGTVTFNVEIRADSTGSGVAATVAGDIVVGITKTAGVSGDIVPITVVLYRKHA